MSSEHRIQIVLEVTVPKDQAPAEVKDWFTRYLSYFHPSLQPARCLSAKPEPKVAEEPTNPEDLL